MNTFGLYPNVAIHDSQNIILIKATVLKQAFMDEAVCSFEAAKGLFGAFPK